MFDTYGEAAGDDKDLGNMQYPLETLIGESIDYHDLTEEEYQLVKEYDLKNWFSYFLVLQKVVQYLKDNQ